MKITTRNHTFHKTTTVHADVLFNILYFDDLLKPRLPKSKLKLSLMKLHMNNTNGLTNDNHGTFDNLLNLLKSLV